MTINSTTDDLIAEIEAAAKAATPGPHHIYTHQRDDNNWQANADFHAKCQPQTVLALTARIRELEEAQRWVPVTERMPERGVHVLACKVGRKTNHRPFFAMTCGNEMMPWRYIDGDRCDVKVSHWKPISELPS